MARSDRATSTAHSEPDLLGIYEEQLRWQMTHCVPNEHAVVER